MYKKGSLIGERNLAQIENDLLKAEAEFVEANARLKEAEQNCGTALGAINRHQAEFDQAVVAMRQRSIAGSKWQLEMGEEVGASGPKADEIFEGFQRSGALNNSVILEPERLKNITELEDSGPFVIINKSR
jgi:hypothetical protein